MTYAIILAGGVGSRFWPLSTHLKPKQFLSFCSDKSLLEESISRIGNLVGRKNIYIATNKNYRAKVKDCIRKFRLPAKNLLFEPESKNTLAPIGALSYAIFNKDKEAIIIALPSDHLIKKKHKFLEILKTSIKVARDGYIVTLGILPKRPETGYGYIKANSKWQVAGVYKVERFIEKPNLKTAKKLIKDKRFYWNAGIFIFKAQILLEEIRKFQPKLYKILMGIESKNELNKVWNKFPPVSVDYAIMEKTKKLVFVPVDFDWLDLGSWRSVEEFIKKDKFGNISRGSHIDLGSRNITVWSGDKTIATLGLNNLIIVDTKSGLLICAKKRTQDLKKITQILKNRRRP